MKIEYVLLHGFLLRFIKLNIIYFFVFKDRKQRFDNDLRVLLIRVLPTTTPIFELSSNFKSLSYIDKL